jgi:DivIVA domain-containing protein
MIIDDDFILRLISDISNVKFNKKLFKAYNVKDVDQFLDDLITILRKKTDSTYNLKKLEYMINEKNFKVSASGYNINEVNDFLNNLIKKVRI